MTEKSWPWGGTLLGDASLAPYTDDAWSDLWRLLFTTDKTTEGVIRSYLNNLQVTGVTSPVNVATGAAIVDGKVYINDGAAAVSVPTPSGATRQDRIVLRKSWAAQTVRIILIQGAEGGGLPSLTQVDGTTWDIPLASLSTTIGGVITVINARFYATTPLSEASEPLYPQNRQVPLSGIVTAGISQIESSGAGLSKPTFMILSHPDSGGASGSQWEFIAKKTPTAPKVEIHYYMGSANSNKAVMIWIYVAAIGDGDASVTAKVFDTFNSFIINVPDNANTEKVVTLSLTNFDGMIQNDRVIIAIMRVEGDVSDTAVGNFNLVKARFLYA